MDIPGVLRTACLELQENKVRKGHHPRVFNGHFNRAQHTLLLPEVAGRRSTSALDLETPRAESAAAPMIARGMDSRRNAAMTSFSRLTRQGQASRASWQAERLRPACR